MYVIVYQPEGADIEVFGPFSSPQQAAQAIRALSAAAGQPIDVTYSNVMGTIDVVIDGERHRYQLCKLGSSTQLDIHAEIIGEAAADGAVSVFEQTSPPPPSLLSS
jgi:hypothetical protein